MAVSGREPVIRQFPLIPSIDFSGIVKASSHAGFAVGDRLVKVPGLAGPVLQGQVRGRTVVDVNA